MKSVTNFFIQIWKFVKKRWKLLLLLAVILGAILFFRSRSNASKKQTLKFEHPVREDIVKTVDVSGVIDAKQKASLRFAAGGKLTYVGASEGAQVKSGQVLARIDARTLQKQLQQDLNTYFNQRMDFDQGLADRRDIAPTDTLGREAQKEQKNLENKVLDVEIQTIAISNTVLKSPLNGVLVNSPANLKGGDLLASDTFQIVNPNSLVLRVTVDQADISQIRKGQPVEFVLDAYPDLKLHSKVNYISYTSSQTSTGTVFVVELPVEVSDPLEALEKYRIGMNGDAKIEVDRREKVLTIPLAATKQRENKTFVTVKNGDKTEDREVQTGIETVDKVEVKSGLTQSDEIVIPQ